MPPRWAPRAGFCRGFRANRLRQNGGLSWHRATRSPMVAEIMLPAVYACAGRRTEQEVKATRFASTGSGCGTSWDAADLQDARIDRADAASLWWKGRQPRNIDHARA